MQKKPVVKKMNEKNFAEKTKRLFIAVNLPGHLREKITGKFLEKTIKGFSLL